MTLSSKHLWTLSLLASLVACSDPVDEPAPLQDEGDVGVEDESPGEPDTPDAIDGEVAEPDPEPEPLPEMPWSVEEAGFYGVGYRAFEVEYMPEGAEEPRSLRLAIWYPTRDREGEPPKYMDILPREGVIDGASVALEAPAPLLVFSHGHRSFAEQSFFMTEFFASHGWVVVAPTHTGNTLFDAPPKRPPQMFDWRPQDISLAMDTLYGLPESDPLAGLISRDVVLSGHSYGGYTTLAVSGASYDVEGILEDCEIIDDLDCSYIGGAEARFRAGFADPRVKVSIPMAPGNADTFGAGLADIDIPVMLMTGLLDASLVDEVHGTPIWNGLDGPEDIRIQFTTGAHLTFSDGCELLPAAGTNDGCGEGFIDSQEAHRIINAYAMAYARRHLWGDESLDDLLDGERSLSDTVEIEFKEAR